MYNFQTSGFFRIGLRVTNSYGNTHTSYRWSYITGSGSLGCPLYPPDPGGSSVLTIYPNPGQSGSSLTLTSPKNMFEANEKVSVTIWQPQHPERKAYDLVCDVEGQLSTTLHLNKHTPGLYFISTRSASGKNLTQKLTIY